MMKSEQIIIFGTGKIFEDFSEKIDLSRINAIVDNNQSKQGKKLGGIGITSPNKINEYIFKYVVVCSTKYFRQICEQLIYDLHVPRKKIISYKMYLNEDLLPDGYDIESIDYIFKFINAFKINSILDGNLFFKDIHHYSKTNAKMNNWDNINIVACNQNNSKIFQIETNLYDIIYHDCTWVEHLYDLIIYMKYMNFSQILDTIKYTYKVSRYIIFRVPYPSTEARKEIFQYDFSAIGKVIWILCNNEYIIVIDKFHEKENMDLQIYVVTHKPFNPPQVPFYIPIHAGKLGKASIGYIGDDYGEDSISEINPYINECTALYWMWKHVSSEYIGLSHYRRYFLKNEFCHRENLIDRETIGEILLEYDVIVADEHISYPTMVKQVIINDVGKSVYQDAEYIIETLMKNKHPKYMDALQYVLTGYGFYRCNMFITRKEVMDAYCEWLFSFIIDAVKMMRKIRICNTQEQRVIGFFAERMLTVWLMKQNLRIKEMPIIEMK